MGTTDTALTWVDEKISEKRYSNGGIVSTKFQETICCFY